MLKSLNGTVWNESPTDWLDDKNKRQYKLLTDDRAKYEFERRTPRDLTRTEIVSLTAEDFVTIIVAETNHRFNPNTKYAERGILVSDLIGELSSRNLFIK